MSSASARASCRPRLRCCAQPPSLRRSVRVAAAACGGRVFGKVYEYEEDLYLVARRFGRPDRQRLDSPRWSRCAGWTCRSIRPRGSTASGSAPRTTSPVTDVTRVSRPWRRNGRRFVQIRLARDRHPQAHARSRPSPGRRTSWRRRTDWYVYRQNLAASALRPGTLKNVGWNGGELVAFRLHLPSKIVVPQRARPRDQRDRATSRAATSWRGNST